MKTFYVSRKRWKRGTKDGALLLHQNGFKCCLGFVGQQCGIPNEKLLRTACPSSIIDGPWPKWITQNGWVGEDYAIQINDDPTLTDKEREAKLRAIFKSNGDRIVFRP